MILIDDDLRIRKALFHIGLVSICHVHGDDFDVLIVIDHALYRPHDIGPLVIRTKFEKATVFDINKNRPHFMDDVFLVNPKGIRGNNRATFTLKLFCILVEDIRNGGVRITVLRSHVCEGIAEGIAFDLFIEPFRHLPVFDDPFKLSAERFTAVVTLIPVYSQHDIHLRYAAAHIMDQPRGRCIAKRTDVNGTTFSTSAVSPWFRAGTNENPVV